MQLPSTSLRRPIARLIGFLLVIYAAAFPAPAPAAATRADSVSSAGDAREELARADTLSASIDRHMQAGRFAEAEAQARDQLEMRRKRLGPSHPQVAQSLNAVAAALWKLGRYSEGEDAAREALAIARQTLGERHAQVADCHNTLGLLLMAQGEFDAAETEYQVALDTFREVVGDENEQVSMCLNNIGALCAERGDCAGAEPYYRAALAMNRRLLGNEHVRVARGLHNLGFIMRGQQDWMAAEELLREALAMRRRLLGPDHPDVALTAHVLGQVVQARGDFEGCEALYREALDIRRATLGDRHPLVAWSLHDLAHVERGRGNYASAERLIREALDINRETNPEGPDVVRQLMVLASIVNVRGDHTGAEMLYREALASNRTGHPIAESQILAGLAGLSSARGDHAAAESLYASSARAFESVRLLSSNVHLRAAWTGGSPYDRLAAERLALGERAEAWAAVERGLGRGLTDLMVTADRSLLPRDDAVRLDSLEADSNRLRRRLSGLRLNAQKEPSAEVKREIESVRTRLLEVEAALCRFQAEVAERSAIHEGYVVSLDKVRATLGERSALVGWLDVQPETGGPQAWGYVIRPSGPVRWVRLVPAPGQGEASRIDLTPVRFREAMAWAASWPARVTAVERIRSEAMTLWEERLAPLASYLVDVEEIVVVPSAPMLGVPVDALVDSDGVYVGDRYALSYAPSATAYAWLRGRSPGSPRPGASAALLVGDPAFRPADPDRVAQENEGAGGQQVATAAGSSAISLYDATVLRSALAGNEEALAALPRLPYSRIEVTRVASLVDDATVLLGPDASEERILAMVESRTLERYNWIHFATHALVDDEDPGRSALVLSQLASSDAREYSTSSLPGAALCDGMLSADEIAREWELHADLVTLSGCQTALGKPNRGEGYIGLAYAFFCAGAQNLLVSLWDVDDAAATLLMQRFYENLTGPGFEKGSGHPQMTKSRALMEAKRWVREYTGEDGSHPFVHPAYWSAFILMGAGR